MLREFDDLDVGGVGGGSGDAEAGSCEEGFVFAIEFVTVAVAFADLVGVPCRPWWQSSRVGGCRSRLRGAWCRPSLRLR